MKKYKVSVIVPVYNVEKYIDRCLNSLINQTLKELEIIIIDDESPDNCPSICDKYAEKYENIVVIHKKNEGLGLARNTGLNIAKGEYVAFIDSDDYIDLTFYEKAYQNAIENNSDICFGETKFLDDNLIEKQIMKNPYKIKKFIGNDVNDYVLANLLHNKVSDDFVNYMATGVWEAIYKKEIFDKYNISFVSERKYISEDYIFHLDYIPKCNIITFVSGIYYYHCDNGSSLTSVYREDRFEKNKILYKEILNKVGQIKFSNDVNPGVYALFIQSIRHVLSLAYLNRKNIGTQKLKEIFSNICNDEFTKIALKNTKEYDFKIKIYNYCLVKNSYSLFMILQCLKNL